MRSNTDRYKIPGRAVQKEVDLPLESRRSTLALQILILCLTISCSKDPDLSRLLPGTHAEQVHYVLPQGFPQPVFPPDNLYTPERARLGKMLFFDGRLSRDGSVSCSSCHRPELAFADASAVSEGVYRRKGTRNSPSLANAAYQPYYTREGGVPTLEMHVFVPVQEHAEMDFNMVEAAALFRSDPLYNELSLKAYGRDLDYYVITRAIANFERTLLSGNSRYDKSLRAVSEVQPTGLEQDGRDLFFSERTSCSECHGGFNFTDYSFRNNGLYTLYSDPGRYRLTADSADIGKFKVPSLRNVALTAPYMHDGSLRDLQEVLQHYNRGGAGHPGQDKRVRRLQLTDAELLQLKAFLESLTDLDFVQNPAFRGP